MAEGCLLGTGMRKLLSDKFRENRSKPGACADTPSKLAGELVRENAPVVTIECYEETAKVAQEVFDKCNENVSFEVPSLDTASSAHVTVQLNVGRAIDLRIGQADNVMRSLSAQIQKGAIAPFDIIFLDADKEAYVKYYNIAMEGYGDATLSGTGRITNMLSTNGIILANNSMCAILYDASDFRSQKLHEFNTVVKNDDRVEQVVLTVREGITMIKPKPMNSYMTTQEKMRGRCSAPQKLLHGIEANNETKK